MPQHLEFSLIKEHVVNLHVTSQSTSLAFLSLIDYMSGKQSLVTLKIRTDIREEGFHIWTVISLLDQAKILDPEVIISTNISPQVMLFNSPITIRPLAG